MKNTGNAVIYKRGITKEKVIDMLEFLEYNVDYKKSGETTPEKDINITNLRLTKKGTVNLISVLEYSGGNYFFGKENIENEETLQNLSKNKKQRFLDIAESEEPLIVLVGEAYFARKMSKIAEMIDGLLIIDDYEDFTNSNIEIY